MNHANYKRNEFGLLEGVEYKFNEDGSVNWRAMIKPEHLYPNREWSSPSEGDGGVGLACRTAGNRIRDHHAITATVQTS